MVTKPAFVTGLKVSGVSYYNQREPVSLQELPRDEAVFHLYSDMTVRPDEKVFYVFNNSAFISIWILPVSLIFWIRRGDLWICSIP